MRKLSRDKSDFQPFSFPHISFAIAKQLIPVTTNCRVEQIQIKENEVKEIIKTRTRSLYQLVSALRR